jgi:hypothetical protein
MQKDQPKSCGKNSYIDICKQGFCRRETVFSSGIVGSKKNLLLKDLMSCAFQQRSRDIHIVSVSV